MVAEGGEEALAVFLKLVRAAGEAVIRVDNLSVSKGVASGEFSGFWVEW